MGASTPPAGLAYAAPGGTSFRTASTRAGDRLNVLDFGLVADGTTDNRAALVSLLAVAAAMSAATGGRTDVVFPSTGASYFLSASVTVPTGVELVGLGKPTIQVGSGGIAFNINVANVVLRNLRIDSQKATYPTISTPISMTGVTGNVLLEDIELVNPRGEIHMVNCVDVTVRRPIVNGSLLHGVYMSGCSDCKVQDGVFQGSVGFGVILTAGCFRNWITGNRTTQNGIELVGVTQDSYENHIIANHSEGTGDNGISITGFKNVVLGNVVKGCQGNGIEVYGERNTIVGNSCHNNAQGNAGNTGWRAGIAIQGAFGGVGQVNVVANNICDDDQAVPTQVYGVWVGTQGYTAWGSGQVISGGGTYRYNGANLYKSVAGGTTGATAPTHTTGTVSDGVVSWTFVRTALMGAFGSFGNEIAGNNIARYGTAKYLDASGGTGATANEISASFQPLVLPSTLTASSIGNTGGVATITISGTYSVFNGAGTTLAVGAPNVSGGQQAAANVSAFTLFGFGTVATGGSGYVVNDIVTLSGGTPTGTASKLKVTAVDGSGAVTTFTSTGAGGGFNYSALPGSGNSVWTGGTGSGFTTTGTIWHVLTVVVSASGSGYTAPPTVSLAGMTGSPVWSVTTSATLSITAGAGSLFLDGSGTKLGTTGAGGSATLVLGGLEDATLATSSPTTGSTVTAANNTNSYHVGGGSTLAALTFKLPAFTGRVGQVFEITFLPAVTTLTVQDSAAGAVATTSATANSTKRFKSVTGAAWVMVQ